MQPQPNERLLEIGCGTGQAIAEILKRSAGTAVHAIDRSEKAVARSRVVNAQALEEGRARIEHADIEDDPVEGHFHRAFAIRVNSFWTKPGLALPNLLASLVPGGTLLVIYDEPLPKIARPLEASFRLAGLQDIRTEGGTGAYAWIGRKP